MRTIGKAGARATIAAHGVGYWRGLLKAKGWTYRGVESDDELLVIDPATATVMPAGEAFRDADENANGDSNAKWAASPAPWPPEEDEDRLDWLIGRVRQAAISEVEANLYQEANAPAPF